jgi:hypothetical protein
VVHRSQLIAWSSAVAIALLGCKGRTASGGDGGASTAPNIPGIGRLIDLVGFEGEIEFGLGYGLAAGTTMSPFKMTILAKGQRFAYELGAAMPPGSRLVVDGSARKAYIVDDAAKEFTATDLSTTVSASSATPAPAPTVTRTKTRDKIAGYECEVWHVTEGARTIDVCAARGLAFVGIGLALGSVARATSGWASTVASAGYFPMRAVERHAGGAELWRYEVTRIDKKSIPEAKVSIPAGYADRTVPIVPVVPSATAGAPLSL